MDRGFHTGRLHILWSAILAASRVDINLFSILIGHSCSSCQARFRWGTDHGANLCSDKRADLTLLFSFSRSTMALSDTHYWRLHARSRCHVLGGSCQPHVPVNLRHQTQSIIREANVEIQPHTGESLLAKESPMTLLEPQKCAMRKPSWTFVPWPYRKAECLPFIISEFVEGLLWTPGRLRC